MFVLVVMMMISNVINSCDAIFPCTVARKQLNGLFQRFEKKNFSIHTTIIQELATKS